MFSPRTVLALTLLAFAAAPAASRAQLWTVTRHVPALSTRAVFDSGRGRLVLFGGEEEFTPSDQTWEWDGVVWTRRFPPASPPARSGHGLAYDAARHRVVLFGGHRAGVTFTDTWEWDGATWTPRSPAVSPPPMTGGGALAYDSARQRTVLIGATTPTTVNQMETWEWDGSTWTRRAVGVPSARSDHAVVYDAARGRVVLFGGSQGTPLGDTWEWDGTTWTQRFPASSPVARDRHALAYDGLRQRVVLFGGADVAGNNLGDTWEWDGTTWRAATPAASPAPRSEFALAYDAARGATVLFGGEVGALAGGAGDWLPQSDTWTFDGTAWRRVDPGAPASREGHSLSLDPARRRVLLFGGGASLPPGSGGFDDLWAWDGTAWSPLPAPAGPSQRSDHAAAFDAARRELVVFGGIRPGAGGADGEMWLWNGTSWRRIQGVLPLARRSASMVYDSGRQRVVLFGGADNRTLFGDTWEWDGTSWTDVTPALGPSPRASAAMAYDPLRARTVLFGGGDATGPRTDTWEWDGSAWTQRSPAHVPPATCGTAAFDPTRGRAVALDDAGCELWAWNGADWSPITMGQGAPGRPLAFDAVPQRLMVYGNATGQPDQTWRFGAPSRAMVVSYGVGCTGALGVPTLDAFGEPALGAKRFAIDVTSARPLAPLGLWLSASPASLPFGPCTVLVSPTDVLAVVANTSNAAGFATVPLPIPALPALSGADLRAQAAVLDPAAPVSGLALTGGLQLVVGG